MKLDQLEEKELAYGLRLEQKLLNAIRSSAPKGDHDPTTVLCSLLNALTTVTVCFTAASADMVGKNLDREALAERLFNRFSTDFLRCWESELRRMKKGEMNGKSTRD